MNPITLKVYNKTIQTLPDGDRLIIQFSVPNATPQTSVDLRMTLPVSDDATYPSGSVHTLTLTPVKVA